MEDTSDETNKAGPIRTLIVGIIPAPLFALMSFIFSLQADFPHDVQTILAACNGLSQCAFERDMWLAVLSLSILVFCLGVALYLIDKFERNILRKLNVSASQLLRRSSLVMAGMVGSYIGLVLL